MTWAEEEFAGADLGDKRLNRRLMILSETFADKPTASIPGACTDWSETQAVYRFFDQANNAKRPLEWLTILTPHMERTEARMRQHPVVLCLQDTTELDFNGQGIDGLGPLSFEAQRGMYLHPTYVVTPEREPLGVTDAWMWSRQAKAADGTRPGVRESIRWTEGYERIAEMASDLPNTRLIYIGDREADIVELMRCARDLGHPADWLIRSKHNRTVPGGSKLWVQTLEGEALGEIEFTLAARPGQTARVVRQQLWARPMDIPDGVGGLLSVTCVVAKEMNPPADCKAVEWRLLTNRTVTDFDEAIELIQWYRCRWEIEIFFDGLSCCTPSYVIEYQESAGLNSALAGRADFWPPNSPRDRPGKWPRVRDDTLASPPSACPGSGAARSLRSPSAPRRLHPPLIHRVPGARPHDRRLRRAPDGSNTPERPSRSFRAQYGGPSG